MNKGKKKNSTLQNESETLQIYITSCLSQSHDKSRNATLYFATMQQSTIPSINQHFKQKNKLLKCWLKVCFSFSIFNKHYVYVTDLNLTSSSNSLIWVQCCHFRFVAGLIERTDYSYVKQENCNVDMSAFYWTEVFLVLFWHDFVDKQEVELRSFFNIRIWEWGSV